jgi:hypothetical protein
LKSLKEGDVLTVWKLDRLGRSLRDLIGMLDELKARCVAFRSLTEAIDTESGGTGKILDSGKDSGWASCGSGSRCQNGAQKNPVGPANSPPKKLLEQNEPPKQVAETFKVSIRTHYRIIRGSHKQ